MIDLKFVDVERSLLPFRVGRRLVFDRMLEMISSSSEIQEPALLLSRLFVRLKSADSIIEKIKRKKLSVQSPSDIPALMDDILGFRLISDDQAELDHLVRYLTREFEVKSIEGNSAIHQFGGQSTNYSLAYKKDGQIYPFEVQVRTFLQHYWEGCTFFLFHKTDQNSAQAHRDDLLALSSTLQSAEVQAEKIKKLKPVRQESIEEANWQNWSIRSRVFLMVVRPHEQFIDQRVIQLTGHDRSDHDNIVSAKMTCYEEYPGAAVVECMCANFATYLLNEPQVTVGSGFIDKANW